MDGERPEEEPADPASPGKMVNKQKY